MHKYANLKICKHEQSTKLCSTLYAEMGVCNGADVRIPLYDDLNNIRQSNSKEKVVNIAEE